MTDDPIEQLRERIRATAAAADRLANGAACGHAGASTDEAAREVQALASLLYLVRDVLPDELRQQLSDLVRQVLLLVRAILDRAIAGLDPGAPAAAPVVQDIPVT